MNKVVWIGSVLFFSLTPTGCGVKGDPKPYVETAASQTATPQAPAKSNKRK